MSRQKPLQLIYHPASSASMRVTLYLRCRGIAPGTVELVSTGLKTDHRGILVFTLPDNHPETQRLGTDDLTALNPEGRVPILLLPDGRKMTQSGPIIDLIESTLAPDDNMTLLPTDPWLRAEAQRIMWIIAADTQPYQNIPFIIQAMGEWGMVKDNPTRHPLRLHFIRREFGAIENLLTRCAGKFSVGDSVTLADCFLVPQIRNALLAEIDLPSEFPILSTIWNNLLDVPEVRAVLDDAGGIVQPLVYDAEQFEVYNA
jgi:maleylacetoacetate isomerase